MPWFSTCQWSLAWNSWPLSVLTSRIRSGKLLDDIVDEGDGIVLGVSVVDFERADTGGIIDGGILIALHRPAIFAL